MTTVEAARETSPLPVKKLVGLIRLEWENLEGDQRGRFVRIGTLLSELRPQVPPRKWGRFVAATFPFSLHSATRYERFAAQTERARATGGTGPRRLSDVDPPRQAARPHHQAKSFASHQEERERIRRFFDANQRLHAERVNGAGERELEVAVANQIIDVGYRTLARETHPDRGGSDAAMVRLSAARDRLRRGLRLT